MPSYLQTTLKKKKKIKFEFKVVLGVKESNNRTKNKQFFITNFAC